MVREIRSTLSGGFLSAQCHPRFLGHYKQLFPPLYHKRSMFLNNFFFFFYAKSTPGEIQLQIHTLAFALYLQASPSIKAWELLL